MLTGQRRHEGIFLPAAWAGARTKASGNSFIHESTRTDVKTCAPLLSSRLSACLENPKYLSFIDFSDWLPVR